MRKALMIDITEIEKYYTITEDGMVYSKIRQRWLKPQLNSYNYIWYSLSYGFPCTSFVFAHTLVALKYIGKPPTEKHEIDHIDGNRENNHYTNLRWLTHSQNILNSYKMGRRGTWFGKKRPSPSLETRIKMSNAKNKRVVYEIEDKRIIYVSIEEASSGLGTYRKMIYNRIKDGKLFKGGTLSFAKEEIPAP